KKDKVMWKTNSGRLVDFAVSSVWNDIRVLGRLKTQDKMGIWEKKDDLKCVFCNKVQDSLNHLFFECEVPGKVWSRLKGLVRLENAPNNWSDILLFMLQRPFNKSIWSVLQRLLIGASIYFIWMERNLRIFQGKSRSVDGICSMIKEAVRLRIMGLTLNDTALVFEPAKLRDFHVIRGMGKNKVFLSTDVWKQQ
ncbi:RNA-directed DNA polymerase, eukaryota, reverse transcriptase zinc-binding domain protein, partial [Tanacetum coccineum]